MANIYEKLYSDTLPVYSVVMPIFNQEQIIFDNLKAIDTTIASSYEMILILDCCSDASKESVLRWAHIEHPSTLTRICIFETPIPWFEASCDNLGCKQAKGTYILEIQADMRMTQPGFNEVLTKPFLTIPNILGVSGRCTHNFLETNGVGRLGETIEKPLDRSLYSDSIFYINETCNRGPLLLDRKKLQALDYFDDTNFPLDYSDHDLFARAWYYKQWVCGYIPIEFDAPLAHGSVRKPRDPLNTRVLKERLAQSNGGFLEKYLNELYIPYCEQTLMARLD